MDKRTARTQARFHRALLELIRIHRYEDISIKQIADHAESARVTFYRHYQDKDELLFDYLGTLFAEMEEILQAPIQFSDTEILETSMRNFVAIFEYVAEHKDVFTIILLGSVASTLRAQWRQFAAAQILQTMHQANDIEWLGDRAEPIATFVAEGVNGLVVWWLENDCQQDPMTLARSTLPFLELGIRGLRAESTS